MDQHLKSRIFAAGAGFGVWILGCLAAMRVEAWDSPLYFSILFPVMIAAAGGMGFKVPASGWRMGLWMVLGHAVAVFVTGVIGGRGFGLLPLTMIVLIIIGLPLIGAAALGAFVRRRVKG
jgi:hypothetical protein